jgi:hypothetical protein
LCGKKEHGKVKVKKTEKRDVDFNKISSFLQLKLQMELDFVNKIDSFNCLGMADPFETSTTMTEAGAYIFRLDFFSQVYPESVIREMTRTDTIKPPRCIFLPYRAMAE